MSSSINGLKKFVPFQGKFRAIEKEIAQFFHKTGDILGLRPKLNVIFFYLMMHPPLTQKEIISLTGYSQSNVSLLLQIMLEIKMVKKQLIPGTNTSVYILQIKKFAFEYSGFYARTRFDSIFAYFESIVKTLQTLIDQQKAGSGLLWMRVQEILLLKKPDRLTSYEPLIQDILNSECEFLKSEALTLTPIEFAPECIAIENEIVQVLVEDEIFLIKQKPSHSKILAYFYTRRVLTQKQLKILTGFSAGVISESLKYFLEYMDIREISQSESHLKSKAKLYGLDFMHYSLEMFFIHYYEKMGEYIPRFQLMLKDLVELPLSEIHKRGYTELYTFLDRFIISELNRLGSYRPRRIQNLQKFYDFYTSIRPDHLKKPSVLKNKKTKLDF
ncbi:MarR family transcriptional regulator [Candidatus Lokiarchaeum ossiferum]|uniref:MarR family transcriptional regulator n=1 Tax=Candidatus Lokiarchaeum ossiferum TaxID=2951803 RepID=UPI00352F168F